MWYDNKGELVNDVKDQREITTIRSSSFVDMTTFVPKGKLRCIGEVAEESYDFLLTMSVVEFMQFTPQPTIITFDRLACMMIAVAWEILGDDEEMREKENEPMRMYPVPDGRVEGGNGLCAYMEFYQKGSVQCHQGLPNGWRVRGHC